MRRRLEIGWGGELVNNAAFKLTGDEVLTILAGGLLAGETKGMLLLLLLRQHRNCGWLADDDVVLARLLDLTPGRWRKHRAELEQLGFVVPGELPGRLVFHCTSQLRLTVLAR